MNREIEVESIIFFQQSFTFLFLIFLKTVTQ